MKMRKDLLIKLSIYDTRTSFDLIIERIKNQLSEYQLSEIVEVKEVKP